MVIKELGGDYSRGGLVTAENTIIGGNATGIGTLNVQDQDSVITVRRLYNGYFGNGTVNISNNGLINNKEYSLVGVQDGSHGVVNVTDKGHWNFLERAKLSAISISVMLATVNLMSRVKAK